MRTITNRNSASYGVEYDNRLENILNYLANEYKDGYVIICRLTPDDYHRYCYIDSGSKGKNYKIDGVLHTVQPICLNHFNFLRYVHFVHAIFLLHKSDMFYKNTI